MRCDRVRIYPPNSVHDGHPHTRFGHAHRHLRHNSRVRLPNAGKSTSTTWSGSFTVAQTTAAGAVRPRPGRLDVSDGNLAKVRVAGSNPVVRSTISGPL